MTKTLARTRFLLPTCTALLAAAPLVAQSPPTLRLEVVATYGWSDMSEATAPLSVNDRRLSAGELGAVGRAVEGLQGDVFVLDPVHKKVAVFDATGVYLRAFGGNGEGPGEFRAPVRIASGPNGSLYVWDRQLKRLSQFAPDGKPIAMRVITTAPAVSDFTVSEGRAWFVRLLMRPGPTVLAFDVATGARADSFATLSEKEVSLSSHGAPGSVATGAAGSIVYAGPFPGELRTWSRGSVRTSGSNRFPDARGVISASGTRSTPVSMRGLAVRPDGTMAMLYSTTTVSRENIDGPIRYWLEILTPDGTSRGKTELHDVESVTGVSATANGDLLLSVVVDYPMVRRVRVTFGRTSGS